MPETIQQFSERIDRQVKEDLAKQDIICPKCGHMWEQEDMGGHVSYWGEDEAKEDECGNCEARVTIKENVTREFEVTLSEQP